MELRDVETFLVVAEELHFGRAAARLFVTQGRVSQTIKALEGEVGGALFERTSRAVRLTALGERFRAGVGPARERLAQTLADCRAEARSVGAQLRIGYLPTIGVTFVNRLVSAFEARHPQCDVVVTTAAIGPEFMPTISPSGGPAEVVLTWSPDGDGHLHRRAGLAVGPVVRTEQRALVVPVRHPLAGYESVSLDDVADYELLNPGLSGPPELRAAWTPLASPSGRPMRHTVEDIYRMAGTTTVSLEDALTLVARDRGLHLSITSALERIPFPGLSVVPVRDMAPMVVVPIWRAAEENVTIRAFVDVAAANRG